MFSDTTYVNEDVVEELGVKGEKELITVNVANDHEVRFQSMTFAIGLESADGSVDANIVAQSSEKICGGMKAVDWVEIKGNWNHLQDKPFPKLANRKKIDVLLGTDRWSRGAMCTTLSSRMDCSGENKYGEHRSRSQHQFVSYLSYATVWRGGTVSGTIR